MKRINTLLFLIVLVFTTGAEKAFSQVAIELSTNRKNYHQYEPVIVKLKIRNFSGTPLIFGNSEKLKGELLFEITEPNSLPQYKKASLGNLILRPGIVEEVQINTSEFYTTSKIGKHRIKAVIKHKQLPSAYQSNPVGFNSAKGIHIWSTTAGIPDVLGENTGKQIESRTYRVDSLFDGVDSVYYLTIEDKKRIYTITRFGKNAGTSKPQCLIDRFSRLHIMTQDNAKIFTYLIYDISGERVDSKKYLKTETSPQLIQNSENGNISVVGGNLLKEDES